MAQQYDLTNNPLEVERYKMAAHLIATGESISSAARQSNVGRNTISRLLRDPQVIGYIQEVRAEAEHKLKLSRQDVLKGYIHAIRQADIQGDPMTQIKGWDSVAKLEGLNAPEKHEHEHSGTIHHTKQELESMSDEQLEEIAQGEVYEHGEHE